MPLSANRNKALLLSVGAAATSTICALVIVIGGLLSYGRGADWSLTLLGGLFKMAPWLAVFAAIGWMAIAAMRAMPPVSDAPAAVVISGTLAGLSLLFAVGAVGLSLYGFVQGASHPNRRIYELYNAACKADRDGVRRALARGVSPTLRWTDISPGDGGDALAAYFKCYKRDQPFDQELVEMLLQAGSSLHSRPIGTPPLETVVLLARPEDRIRASTYLVGKGLSPNGSDLHGGGTLAIAAISGDVQTLEALLRLGAKTDAPDLAIHLFVGNRQYCRDVAKQAWDTAPFNLESRLQAADLLIARGMKVTAKALERGKTFCLRSENVIVTHVESRLASGNVN